MKSMLFALVALFVMMFAGVANAEVGYVELSLGAGETVSEVVYTQVGLASVWRTDLVTILHPQTDVEYTKDDIAMSRLPQGARVRIDNALYGQIIRFGPESEVARLEPVGVLTPRVVWSGIATL